MIPEDIINESSPRPPKRKVNELIGFGAFKDSLPSTEEFIREKRLETAREDNVR